MFDPLPPLTDAQVQAGARPGESWAAARRRLEAGHDACAASPDDDRGDVDPALTGPKSNECLDDDFGQPIQWQPGELGYLEYE